MSQIDPDAEARLAAEPVPYGRCRASHEHDDFCHEAPLEDEADDRIPCDSCNGIGEKWITASTSVPCHCNGGYEWPVGPGSTSPEPGPPAAVCPEYPDCREERYVRDLAASLRAGEPVGKWVSGCAACRALSTEDGAR